MLCAQQWRGTPAWTQAFAIWREHGWRKVTLRADASQFGRLRDELDCALLDGPDGETLLCLPPRQKSAREPLLAHLAAYTDAPRPDRQPPTVAVMRYVVRAAVMKSMGKAMAQAGHAALMCADGLEQAHRRAFAPGARTRERAWGCSETTSTGRACSSRPTAWSCVTRV